MRQKNRKPPAKPPAKWEATAPRPITQAVSVGASPVPWASDSLPPTLAAWAGQQSQTPMLAAFVAAHRSGSNSKRQDAKAWLEEFSAFAKSPSR